MKKKLSEEEIHAFLNMFDKASVQIRRLSTQSRAFRFSLIFTNVYTVGFILFFYVVSRFFSDFINSDVFTEGYVNVLNSRAYTSLWLIAAINISYFFNFYFRFFAVLMLMYVVNASIDQTLMFVMHYTFTELSLILIFYFTKPLMIAALVVMMMSYDEQM